MKMLIGLFILFSQLAAAKAPELGCLNYDKTMAVYNRINIYTGEKKADICDTNSRFYRVMEALLFLRGLNLDGPSPAYPYSQSILGTELYSRILRLSPSISWGPYERQRQQSDFFGYGYSYGTSSGSHSCVNAVAYTQVGGRKMYFCPNAFKNLSNSSVLFIAGTIIHETRHLEGRTGYQHVPCNGYKQGCDPSADYRGAFAAEMEALAKIGVSATNVHPSLSYLARRMAFQYGRENFKVKVAPELKHQSVIILTDARGKHLAYNHRFKSSAFEFLSPGKLIEIRDGQFILTYKDGDLEPRFLNGYNFQTAEPDEEYESTDSVVFDLFSKAGMKDRENFKGSAEVHDFDQRAIIVLWGDSIRLFVKKFRYEDKIEEEKEEKEKLVAELKLPSGTPLLLRADESGGGYADDYHFHVLNDKDQLFKIELNLKTMTSSVTEIPNPYPGFTYVSKVQVRDEYEKWEEELSKWLKKNKKNDRKDYPIEAPKIGSRTYLLDKDGRLHYQNGDQFPVVQELYFYRFESMSSGQGVQPEHPAELSTGFF